MRKNTEGKRCVTPGIVPALTSTARGRFMHLRCLRLTRLKPKNAALALCLAQALFATRAPLRVAAQRLVIVSDSVECRTCVIALEPVLTLMVPDTIELTDAWHIRRDSRGRLYVTSEIHPGQLLVFSPSGSYIRSWSPSGALIGRRARIETFLFDDGDTLHVFDRSNQRYSVHDPDLTFVRSGWSPAEVSDAATIDGTIVIAANILTSSNIGFPLHRIDHRGAVLRSFGASHPEYNPDMQWAMRRRIAVTNSQTFWTAHVTRYELERRDANLQHDLTVRRDGAWFPSYRRVDPDARLPFLQGITTTQDGLLWTSVAVDASIPIAAGAARRLKMQDRYDTILEAIDPERGRVVARIRSDRYLKAFVAPGLIWSFEETSARRGIIRLWRVTLEKGQASL